MFTPDGVKVLEYNVRFGDPETQVVLPRLTSSLSDLLFSGATNRAVDVDWSGRYRSTTCRKQWSDREPTPWVVQAERERSQPQLWYLK